MASRLLTRERIELSEIEFVELVVWQVDSPVRGSRHSYKYRLAFISNDRCVVRFDNEAGKGDHKHIGKRELPYPFSDVATLRVDFLNEVAKWRSKS